MARNPFNPVQVTRFRIDPEVVDLIAFCTKNPALLLPDLHELSAYLQFWFVTITPYGKEIEPGVPEKSEVCASFRKLSEIVGKRSVGWRYDPIFLNETYSPEYHLEAFERLAEELAGYTEQVYLMVVSLIRPLYVRPARKWPEKAVFSQFFAFIVACIRLLLSANLAG